MKSRIIILTLLVSGGAAGLLMAAESGHASGLRIHLPRQLTIEDDVATLGEIGILLGDQKLQEKAEKIPLGRIAMPGQEISVSRSIILSRLASVGVNASAVTFSGAESVTVSRPHRAVTGEDFVQFAAAFLKTKPRAAGIHQFEPVASPQGIVLAETESPVTFTPSIAKSPAANLAIIEITIKQGDTAIDTRRVIFRAKYNCRVIKAVSDIAQGAVVTQENVRIDTVVSEYPEPADWTAPYGLIARRKMPAETVIRPDMLTSPKPPVVIKRNENVVIQIDRLGLLITAMGRSLQEGHTGEFIKVQNIDSQRVIICKVNEDGTVEPVF